MDIPREIHTYLIPLAMVWAFVHVEYLIFRAFKKQIGIRRTNLNHFSNPPKIYLKPFLFFVLWNVCIGVYIILAVKQGWLRETTTDMWPRGEETFSIIPFYSPHLIALLALVVTLVVGIVLYFKKRNTPKK